MPYQPGGATDAVARMVAQQMAALIGQNVVVENRSGGSGAVGGLFVARAAPDGTTLMFNASVHVISPLLTRTPAYDAVADFQPVAQVARGPLLFVCHPSVQADGLAALAAQIRAAPDRFTFATSSRGSAGHLAAELFKQRIGVDVLVAPYNGSAQALADMVGGRVNLMIDPVLSALPFVRGGQLKALAVTSAERLEIAPEIPTAAEAGLDGLEFYSWYGVWAPRGLPPALLQQISADVVRAGSTDEARQFLIRQGFQPTGLDADAFSRFIDEEVAKYRGIIARANIVLD
ncbi:Bug family tripartite tricarboxylate transporter substrate binding protein [Humitalea sp. 24SJ18S-53]|uniref:Bug family tripartite tricarboxylate transporter substrate binding protein n=1 Tax=Humitalea sp. 24SJ18S-53 TaxID=3422307 RepID=UPI003D67055D